jgi:hypothetical protein
MNNKGSAAGNFAPGHMQEPLPNLAEKSGISVSVAVVKKVSKQNGGINGCEGSTVVNGVEPQRAAPQ